MPEFVVQSLPLGLSVLGLIFALIAAFTPVSPQKGWRRLAASMLVGAAFGVGSTAEMFIERRLWPGALGILIGSLLIWIGFRKHKRDPEGITPPASIL